MNNWGNQSKYLKVTLAPFSSTRPRPWVLRELWGLLPWGGAFSVPGLLAQTPSRDWTGVGGVLTLCSLPTLPTPAQGRHPGFPGWVPPMVISPCGSWSLLHPPPRHWVDPGRPPGCREGWDPCPCSHVVASPWQREGPSPGHICAGSNNQSHGSIWA